MEKILPAYDFPKETATAIKVTKAMVRSPDNDTNYYNIIYRIL